MILRPVSPQSPTGPPTTNRPVGLMWYFVRLSIHLVGSTGFRISSITASRSAFVEMPSLGCVESTPAPRPTGLPRRRALRMRAQPRELALLAHFRLLLHEAMRERDRRGHEPVGFVRREAKHQA